MRSEELYLLDIVEAIDEIASFLQGRTRDQFLIDRLVQSAVLQKFGIIGEASGSISQELRTRHPEVPWQNARALRNVAVHAYFTVDWSVIWDTAIDDLPPLRMQLARILDAEFPDGRLE